MSKKYDSKKKPTGDKKDVRYPDKKDGKYGKKPYDKKDDKKDYRKDDKAPAKLCDYDSIKSNDIAWYNKNPIQFDLATRTPAWAQIQGAPYASGSTLPLHLRSIQEDYTDTKNTLPGIMAINFIPSIGISKDANSPVNKAFNRLMSELYARTSGSALNFQQADLAMMITSLASLASLFAHIKRVLGTKDFWITRNINYPRLLCKALGCSSYDDMVKNFNSYVSRLNNDISIFNSIKIPNWFDIFARQYSMCKNVYLDEDSDFGQIFAYVPEAVWEYDDENAQCTLRSINSGVSTVGEYLDTLEDLLGKWMNSSDLYLINGALLRAFGDANTIFIEPFSTDERINPIVDENMAMQLMNCTLCGQAVEGILNDHKWVITQQPDKNAIIFNPRTEVSSHAVAEFDPDGILCRAFKDAPTADDNMEMTRLAVIGTCPAGKYAEIESCGTEVVLNIEIFTNDLQGDDDNIVINSNVHLIKSASAVVTNSYDALINTLQYLSTFRYVPRMCIAGTKPGTNTVVTFDYGDMYNYSFLSREDLGRLHETALYSIWKPDLK